MYKLIESNDEIRMIIESGFTTLQTDPKRKIINIRYNMTQIHAQSTKILVQAKNKRIYK